MRKLSLHYAIAVILIYDIIMWTLYKIEYFEGRFELVDEKINNFVPEIYSAEAGLEKVDELSEDNGNLADEVMNYVKLLLALQNKNPNRKYYTKEQMDKLLLLGHRAQKNYDILINY